MFGALTALKILACEDDDDDDDDYEGISQSTCKRPCVASSSDSLRAGKQRRTEKHQPLQVLRSFEDLSPRPLVCQDDSDDEDTPAPVTGSHSDTSRFQSLAVHEDEET